MSEAQSWRSDLSIWIAAVLKHWLLLISGGTASLFGWLWAQYGSGSIIPPAIFVGSGGFLFVAAFFQAWRVEHIALVELERRLKSPEYGGELLNVFVTQNGHLMALSGHIANPTGPASAVRRWRVGLKTTRGENYGIVWGVPAMDHRITFAGTDACCSLAQTEYWVLKGAQQIPAGGLAYGWLLASFETPIHDLIDHSVSDFTVTLTFEDVISGRPHTLSKTVKVSETTYGVIETRND